MFNINENKLGTFWVENHEETSFSSIIEFNEEGFELTFTKPFKIPSDDKNVLINGVVGKESISFVLLNYPPTDIDHYLIYDVCLGMHFDTKEDIKFERIMFKINNISSVIGLYSLRYNLSDRSDVFPLKRESFEEVPPTIEMEDFVLKIELNNGYEHWKIRGNGQKITFEEDISIVIEYEKPQKLKTIHENITRVERLFTLLTGKSKITELKGMKEDKEITILSEYLLKEDNVRRIPGIQLDKNIKKVFTNWLTKYDEMNSVYDLFYSINESKVNSITLFLTYSQILENYHRQKYDGEYLTKESFEPIKEEIKECIKSIENEKFSSDEQFRDKILASIVYSYEYSFKDRLIEIFDELESYDLFNKILEKYAKNSNEPKELAKIIKDNRNYYTHYGDKPDKLFTEEKLHEFNDSICKIIRLILLKETGFEADEINKYIDYPLFYFTPFIPLEY